MGIDVRWDWCDYFLYCYLWIWPENERRWKHGCLFLLYWRVVTKVLEVTMECSLVEKVSWEITWYFLLWKFGKKFELKVLMLLFLTSERVMTSGISRNFFQIRLHDALNLLEQVCSEPKFHSTWIFVFLNEVDVLAEKLGKVPIEKNFPEYNGKIRVLNLLWYRSILYAVCCTAMWHNAMQCINACVYVA